jgi:hypothetical protein
VPTVNSSAATLHPAEVGDTAEAANAPDAHRIYSEEKQCFCFPSELYFSRNARHKNFFITCMLAPPTSVAFYCLQQFAAQVSKQGLYLFLTWSAVQDVVKWLNALYAFFWYVQVCTISRLVGKGDKERVGAAIAFSSVLSVCCGVLTMVLAIAIASPLLELFEAQSSAGISSLSPKHIVRGMGTDALRVIAISHPATVFSQAAAGVLMGFHRVFVPGMWLLIGYAIYIFSALASLMQVLDLCTHTRSPLAHGPSTLALHPNVASPALAALEPHAQPNLWSP